MAAHHADTGAYSFPYVATWAYPLAVVEHVGLADIVTRIGTRVMNAATGILHATTTATSSWINVPNGDIRLTVTISARSCRT